MTEPLRYAAFTTTPAGGNPAGVVLDASDLDEAAMLDLAARLGYSESAFVTPLAGREREFGIRYFSPRHEVAFCGHATIATSVALAERLGPGPLLFATSVGEVTVDTDADGDGFRATLTSIPPTTRPATDDEVDRALAALRWAHADLDESHPPHVTNAGVTHLILAVKSRERLAALDYDMDALGALMAELDWTTLQLVFAERPGLFHARNPFPPGGIFEDPATGAAAAALGGYLRELGLTPDPPQVVVLQGVETGRPGRLEVEIPPSGGIRVSGHGVQIPS
jgi:PhzF family phenazine biosynthesis protein